MQESALVVEKRRRSVWSSAKKTLRVLTLIFLVAATSACFSSDEEEEGGKQFQGWKDRKAYLKSIRDELEKLEKEIKELTKDQHCSISAHCDVMGVGPILCGKQKKFVVYSVRRTAVTFLKQKVKRYNELSEELNKQSYKALACGVDPPKVACIERVCRAMK